MDKFIDACIDRYRTIILILLMILIAGTVSYRNIPKESNPDIQIPFVFVSMTHEGISPEDGERLLLRPMEKELRSIEGIKEMTSYATEGSASINLEFYAGFDSDKALNDVREKVDTGKAELPSETEEPIVQEVNLSLFPVVNVIMTAEISEYSLISMARNLRDKIEEIPNVLDVEIGGDREDAVEVIIDPMVLQSYGLTIESLNSVAVGFNRLIASGALDNKTGRYSIKVPGLLENLNDILSLPVKVNGDAVITVRDIATIKKTFKDPEGFARANGVKSIVLEVSKRSGTNIIETIDQVKEVVEYAKMSLPEGIDIQYSQDQSNNIKDMLSDLENNIILAILLVMSVILYFVGFRSAALVTVSIPGSFLIGILIISSLGLNLNIVVLFSLILSIGMLVDSSIIICEMADRKMSEGVKYSKAYIDAAKYMKWPIIVSTATTLVVFMPLLFWPGIVGQFMQYMPITLIATLSGSLFMAIIFIPTIGSIISKGGSKVISNDKFSEIHSSKDVEKVGGFTSKYYKTLKLVLGNSKKFVFVICSSLVAVYIYYGAFGTGFEFFPEVEPENSQIQVRARGNLSVYEKDELLREVESKILDMEDEILVFYSRSGRMGNSHNLPEDTIGTIQIEYKNWQERRTAKAIQEDIKNRTKEIGGILIDIQDQEQGPGQAKPIEIEVSSYDKDLIKPVVEKIVTAMQNIDGITDLEDSRPIPAIEWEMALDREMAARFGVDVGVIGNFIKLVTNGMIATSYRPDDADDEVDILVRFPEEKRNISNLDYLRVVTDNGSVPISNFVKRVGKPKIETIHRTDGYPVVTIKSGVAEGFLADNKVREVKEYLKSLEVDSNVRVKFKGDDEEQRQAGEFLQNAFMLALFFMALILITQFNSIYYMFIILSAVFLSTVGVLVGLILTGQPFGIVMCGVGIISLSGIVVNNNIIFIDTYQRLKKDGVEIKEALLLTGVQRLRPILLTAGTTILGLMPMVLGVNIDFISQDITFGAPSSQWWKQLSTSIAGGLAFATVLTLFFTPSLLFMWDGRKDKSSPK